MPKPLEFRFKIQSPNSQSKVSLCFYFPPEVSTFLPPSLLSESHASLFNVSGFGLVVKSTKGIMSPEFY